MYLIVGLGNPGESYAKNRHNIGFMAVDRIAKFYSFSRFDKKFSGLFATGMIDSKKVSLLKPQTFMNKSGISVLKLASFYKIPIENIIIMYDELDIPIGKVKVKTAGGSGGHNGIKSIDSFMDKNYTRVRIGISRPSVASKVSSYVLSDFSDDEIDYIDEVLDCMTTNTDLLLNNNASEFMNKIAISSAKFTTS